MSKYVPNIVTSHLEQFHDIELSTMVDILNCLIDGAVPEEFVMNEVQVMHNKNSGFVFLTNSEFQTALIREDAPQDEPLKLEMWYYCGECGAEGFAEQINFHVDTNECGKCYIKNKSNEGKAE